MAFGVTRLIWTLLFNVSPLDPVTFAGASALLALTAAIACLIPALKATRVEPIIALRHE